MTMSSAARFCPTCGQALPGPVQLCPRCGANIGSAVGVQKKSNAGTIVAIVLVSIMGGVFCLGILAAIAIPNFIKYQLRSKQSQVSFELEGLAKAEHSLAQATGKYVVIEAIPAAADPSPAKVSFSADELATATSVDWLVSGTTYGQYSVAVSEDGRAASLCGESDIDGDGERAAFAIFLPGDGVAPPPAPCTEPVAYSQQYAAGVLVRVTGPNVF